MVLWCMLVIASAVAAGQISHANVTISEHAVPLPDLSTSRGEEFEPLQLLHSTHELSVEKHTNTSKIDNVNKVTSDSKSPSDSNKSNRTETSKPYTITASEFEKKRADTLKDENADEATHTKDPSKEGRKEENSLLKEVKESTTKVHEILTPSSVTTDYKDPAKNSNLTNKHEQSFNVKTTKKPESIAKPDLLHDLKIAANNTGVKLHDVENALLKSENKSSVNTKNEKLSTNKRQLPVSTSTNVFIAKDNAADNATLSFTEVAIKVSDEIKSYSNDLVVAWDQGKVKISQSTEATTVLKDYMDKISISQAANNTECVKKDLVNHAARVKKLQEIIKSCETGLKRKDWHELQNKTRETLDKINTLVQEVINSKNLSKVKEDYATIENNAKKKLNQLDVESIKKTFSQLKNNSLKTDEEEYEKCINDRTQKGLVSDTMNDIMRIKNNCVG